MLANCSKLSATSETLSYCQGNVYIGLRNMTNHAAAVNDDDAGNVGHDGSDDGDEDAVGVGLVERICWNWG